MGKPNKAAADLLRKQIKPGQTVWTVLKHVSRSGLTRVIDCYVMQDNEPRRISYQVSDATGLPFDKQYGGVRVGGCGMDMGFQVVYLLGHALWPDGTPEPHGTRNGEPDSDGGYALKQRWLG